MLADEENNQDDQLDDEQDDQEDDAENQNDDEQEDSEEDDSSENDDDSEDDDSKPVSRKEFNKLSKKLEQKDAVIRRLSKGKDGKAPKGKDNADDETVRRVDSLEFSEKKRQFGHENKLSPAEADFIFGLNKNPTKKFLETPFVKGGLAEMRREDNVRNNTPHTQGRSFGAKNVPFEKLDKEGKNKNFNALQESILRSKGRR